jgi:hypothetical protein
MLVTTAEYFKVKAVQRDNHNDPALRRQQLVLIGVVVKLM